MTLLTEQLFDALKSVRRPGNFYAAGKLDVFLPRLEVQGVGRIAWPLLPVQAQQLAAVAEQAPYGRGPDTVVDTTVRRTWQIDAQKITLSGKHWQENVQTIIDRAAAGLGVSGEVNAELYKMLLYDAGGFFVDHRDTEKTAGMFATLVLVLPSAYSGGELVIKHQQQQITLDLRSDDEAEIGFAAFYADCVHEVLPVTSGYRLALIYNLVRPDKKLPLPKPPDYLPEQARVTSLLRDWAQQLSTDSSDAMPQKLIYLLEHAYTSAELAFDHLKNADAAVAEVLAAGAADAQCDLHLALVSVEESGTAEYTGGGRWDDPDYEVGEVFDRTETVSEWRRMDGRPSPLPALPFRAEEFCPPGAFEKVEADDIEFEEATGNAGASFERRYRYAALVMWPMSRYLAMINQAGFDGALPVLADLCNRWEAELDTDHSNLREEARTLAGYMLRDGLPDCFGKQVTYSRDTSAGVFLDCLVRLRDVALVSHFWSHVAATGFYKKEISAAFVQTSEWLPWTDVVTRAEQAFALSASSAQDACAHLLAHLCLAKPTQAKDLCAAARTLFMALPGDPMRSPAQSEYDRFRTRVAVEWVVDVLTSFSAIDAALADEALDYLLAWPATYPRDKILLPAAIHLTETPSAKNLPVVKRLREHVRLHLSARIAETLEPPRDWKRESNVSCRCNACGMLRSFLKSPTQSVWSFKAAEAMRKHVQSSISSHSCDVDCITDRSGRPYSLVCTKNQNSYLRRVEQRQLDRDNFARLASE